MIKRHHLPGLSPRTPRRKKRSSVYKTVCKRFVCVAIFAWVVGQFFQLRVFFRIHRKPQNDDIVNILASDTTKKQQQTTSLSFLRFSSRKINNVHQNIAFISASEIDAKRNRTKPRVMSWFMHDSVGREPEILDLKRWGPIPPRGVEMLGHDRSNPVSKTYPHTDKDCEPYFEWQTKSFPTCNSVHEFVTLSESEGQITYLSQGTSRQVWQYHNPNKGGQDFALKVMMMRRVIDEAHAELSRLDGLTLERMTKSPFAPNIYSYCANAQILELAKGGAFHDMVKRLRFFDLKLSSMDKLRIAFHISSAVADMHELGYIAHHDICCHQFLFSDKGIFQINDFHLARQLYKHKNFHQFPTSSVQCKEDWKLAEEKLRAPEEYFLEKTDIPIHMDKVDVYMMGHLMYYALTNLWLFEGMTNKEARDFTLHGARSPFPAHVVENQDPAIVATQFIIENMCWVHDPDERPSARAISLYAQQKLEELDPKFDINSVETFRLESVPSALPRHWRFTDSDYNRNFVDSPRYL